MEVKKLLRDNILVRVIPEEDEVLATGIIMPSVRKEKRLKGVVVATGPGYKDCPVTTKIGDVVYVDRDLAQPWEEQEEVGEYPFNMEYKQVAYMIVKENDIAAIL